MAETQPTGSIGYGVTDKLLDEASRGADGFTNELDFILFANEVLPMLVEEIRRLRIFIDTHDCHHG